MQKVIFFSLFWNQNFCKNRAKIHGSSFTETTDSLEKMLDTFAFETSDANKWGEEYMLKISWKYIHEIAFFSYSYETVLGPDS